MPIASGPELPRVSPAHLMPAVDACGRVHDLHHPTVVGADRRNCRRVDGGDARRSNRAHLGTGRSNIDGISTNGVSLPIDAGAGASSLRRKAREHKDQSDKYAFHGRIIITAPTTAGARKRRSNKENHFRHSNPRRAAFPEPWSAAPLPEAAPCPPPSMDAASIFTCREVDKTQQDQARTAFL